MSEHDLQQQGERLLRLPDVIARTGLGKSAIYQRMRESKFPLSLKLGPRSIAWPESEISRWIAERIRASRGAR